MVQALAVVRSSETLPATVVIASTRKRLPTGSWLLDNVHILGRITRELTNAVL